MIGQIKKKMEKAAAELNFEAAAEYRDQPDRTEKYAAGYVADKY